LGDRASCRIMRLYGERSTDRRIEESSMPPLGRLLHGGVV
jgi:hypothetical protein